jgi:hypothetical protein
MTRFVDSRRIFRHLRREIVKSLAMLAIVLTMEIGARAHEVTVYVQDALLIPVGSLRRAQVLANEIFVGAGVEVNWHRYRPAPWKSRRASSILVVVCTNTPRQRLPSALAVAVPDGGGHITVFYDRIKKAAEFEPTYIPLLAHVFVHEIAHIVEGSEMHSDGGVMKATWSQKDIRSMRWRPLVFGQEDVEAIKAGLAKRADAESPISVYPAP